MIDQQTDQHASAFEGFIPPTSNYFPMPNGWIDICAAIDNLAELKVIQYVLRHTWGYKEYDGTPKAITTDEFMHGRKRAADHSRMDKGTGLSNRSVIDGLRRAVDHGYLTCTVNDEDKARISKSYALRMASPEVKSIHTETTGEGSTQQLSTTYIADVKYLHSCYEDSAQRSEKDTSERHQEKNTLEKHGVLSASTEPQAGKHLHGTISDARAYSTSRITGESHSAPVQMICSPLDEPVSTGPGKLVRAPELSTPVDAFPHPCVKASARQGVASKKRGQPASEAITLSPKARVIFDAWCTLFKVEVDLTPANARGAEKLVKPLNVWCSALKIPLADLLKEIMNWLYATDKTGYYQRGVKLYDVSREFEGWQSAKERAQQNKTSVPHIPTREEDPYSVAALLAAQNPSFFA